MTLPSRRKHPIIARKTPSRVSTTESESVVNRPSGTTAPRRTTTRVSRLRRWSRSALVAWTALWTPVAPLFASEPASIHGVAAVANESAVHADDPRWNDRNPTPWNRSGNGATDVRPAQHLRWQSSDGKDRHLAAEFHAPGQPQSAVAEDNSPAPEIWPVQYQENLDADLVTTAGTLRVVQGDGPELLAPDDPLGDELFLNGPANGAQPASRVQHPLFAPARSGAAPIVMLPPAARRRPTSSPVQQTTLMLAEADGSNHVAVAQTIERVAPPAIILAQRDSASDAGSTEMDFKDLFPGSEPPALPDRPTPAPRSTAPRSTSPATSTPRATTPPSTSTPSASGSGTAAPKITIPRETSPRITPPTITEPAQPRITPPTTRTPAQAAPKQDSLFVPPQTKTTPVKPPTTTTKPIPKPIPDTQPATRPPGTTAPTTPESSKPELDLFESIRERDEQATDTEPSAPADESGTPPKSVDRNNADFQDLFPPKQGTDEESTPATEPADTTPPTAESPTQDLFQDDTTPANEPAAEEQPTTDDLFKDVLPSDATPEGATTTEPAPDNTTPIDEPQDAQPPVPGDDEDSMPQPMDEGTATESPADTAPDRESMPDDLFGDTPSEDSSDDTDSDFNTDEESDDRNAADKNCDRVYNDRNCCTVDKNCNRIAEFLRTSTLDKISLEVSPTMTPGEDSPEKAAETRKSKLAKIPTRTWMNRQGQVVATGYLHDMKGGQIIVRDDSGNLTPVQHLDLGNDELCFVNAYWGLPNECLLPDDEAPIRNWTMITYTWKASALCHKPTYFEDTELERYGHSPGPVLEPVFAAAHFFTHVALLPYNMRLHPANECMYTLGHYRPGSCAPWLVPAFPLSGHAAASQTLTVLGLWGVLH